MHVDADGEYRLSVAGAQDKLPVVVDDSGRIGLTRDQTPSTHIIKTPIERLDHTAVNTSARRWESRRRATTSQASMSAFELRFS